MDNVLHAELHQLNSGLNALQHHLDGRAGVRRRADGTTGVISLDTANSLWAQAGTRWQDEFLHALARSYGAGVRLVDYVADAEAARLEINSWTAHRTHDRISELVPPEALSELTRLVLVNAIYLKAPWEEPFEPVLSRPAPFTRADGSTTSALMMHGSLRSAGFSSGPGWRAVDLPYAGSQLAMAIVLPDEGNLVTYERALDGAALARLLTRFRPARVSLDLPRWTFRTQSSLTAVLAKLGMPTAFTPSADFTGMTTQAPLMISDVLHEAFIAVDEAGTEAAAATAVEMEVSSAQPEPVIMTSIGPSSSSSTTSKPPRRCLSAASTTRLRSCATGAEQRETGFRLWISCSRGNTTPNRSKPPADTRRRRRWHGSVPGSAAMGG